MSLFTESGTHRGSFLARTLASNFTPFLATYSASLSMTGWTSGGGGMMAGMAAGARVLSHTQRDGGPHHSSQLLQTFSSCSNCIQITNYPTENFLPA